MKSRRLLVFVAIAVIALAAITSTVTRRRPPQANPLAIIGEGDVHDGIVVVRQQVLDNTNRLRAANGAGELQLSGKLNGAAQDHSDYMARTRNFVHSTDLEATMNRLFGDSWRYAGENIGVFGGQLSVLLTSLRQSPEHRQNMLKPQYRRIGIGATWDSDDERLWLTIWFMG